MPLSNTGDFWNQPTIQQIEWRHLPEPAAATRLMQAFLAASNEERVAFFRWLAELAEGKDRG